MADKMTTNAKRRSRSGQRLVHATAERLREMIYATEPESRIGSLTSLAETLGVGIVTVQQAARILEHEGLLEVRRGARMKTSTRSSRSSCRK